MKRSIDLSVTVNDATPSAPSTKMRLEITPHRRGPGVRQVPSVHRRVIPGDLAPFYEIAGTEGAPARFFATVD